MSRGEVSRVAVNGGSMTGSQCSQLGDFGLQRTLGNVRRFWLSTLGDGCHGRLVGGGQGYC